MRSAAAVSNMRKAGRDCRKLRSACKDPRFWSSMVEAEAYRAFDRQWEDAHREKGGN